MLQVSIQSKFERLFGSRTSNDRLCLVQAKEVSLETRAIKDPTQEVSSDPLIFHPMVLFCGATEANLVPSGVVATILQYGSKVIRGNR